MADDLFSGWGVRTLSAAHPSYNPFAYHLGTVWPVENATFALGFKRYGLDEHADRLIRGMLDAAAHFAQLRLPEALAGHARTPGESPAVYPQANSPQAWSASATVQLIQAQLGIYPYAAAHVLALARPRLPEWLPEVTLRRIRVGAATVSLRFRRQGDGSARHEVIEREGALRVIEVPPPNDLYANASRCSTASGDGAWSMRRARPHACSVSPWVWSRRRSPLPELRERRAFVHRDVIGLVAVDLVLRVLLAGMDRVPLELDPGRGDHSGDRGR